MPRIEHDNLQNPYKAPTSSAEPNKNSPKSKRPWSEISLLELSLGTVVILFGTTYLFRPQLPADRWLGGLCFAIGLFTLGPWIILRVAILGSPLANWVARLFRAEK